MRKVRKAGMKRGPYAKNRGKQVSNTSNGFGDRGQPLSSIPGSAKAMEREDAAETHSYLYLDQADVGYQLYRENVSDFVVG